MKKLQKKSKITAKEFDKQFDDEEDILDHLDVENAVVRVLVDFPQWMLKILDDEAKRLSIPRQAVIKHWLNDRIEEKQKVS